MSKLKILWICHFSNPEVQSKLPIWKRGKMFASWIPNIIKGFEGNNEIELYIISPHNYLKKQTKYIHNNVHYHFLPYGIPILNRSWPGFFPFDAFTNYFCFREKVKKLVAEIKPDLINLFGAENSYYSSSILDFKDNYPVLITIQGLISQMKDSVVMTKVTKKRIEIEEKILQAFEYFSGDQDSSKYIYSYNPNHKYFTFFYIVNEDLIFETTEQEEKYDCIFYGNITKNKGIEDFIKIIAKLKIKRPTIMAGVVGIGNILEFQKLAMNFGCELNIKFFGFLKTQKELFKIVKSSKVLLVPTYFDRHPSTIREAMFLKVPVVAYATGGIPYINEFDENIYIVERGDTQSMYEKVLYLLQNEDKRIALAEKAYRYAQNEFSLVANIERLITAYKQIICNTDHKQNNY